MRERGPKEGRPTVGTKMNIRARGMYGVITLTCEGDLPQDLQLFLFLLLFSSVV